MIGFGAGLTAFFIGWDGWLSQYDISLGDNLAAVNQHFTSEDQNITQIDNAINQLNSSLSGVKGYRDPPLFTSPSLLNGTSSAKISTSK